jgi:hypothetical protein
LSAILGDKYREDEQFFEEHHKAELNQKYTDAINLLEAIRNLAARGSSAIQAAIKAILVASIYLDILWSPKS